MTRVRRFRATVLNAVFRSLYGPLAVLHEPVGRALFGAAWDGRRQWLLRNVIAEPLLDLGCGEGRLLADARRNGRAGVGIEPSAAMARRARRRGALVVRARAEALPIADGSAGGVVCSYPGRWIIDDATWRELARVLAPSAPIAILMGGDYRRGRLSALRSLALRVAYGGQHGIDPAELPALRGHGINGSYVKRDDAWGTAVFWLGRRA